MLRQKTQELYLSSKVNVQPFTLDAQILQVSVNVRFDGTDISSTDVHMAAHFSLHSCPRTHACTSQAWECLSLYYNSTHTFTHDLHNYEQTPLSPPATPDR